MRLQKADYARVSGAVTAAERTTSGEIVTIVARQSDAYHDAALHWSVLAMLIVLALLALWPGLTAPLHPLMAVDPWGGEVPLGKFLTEALVVQMLVFLLVNTLLRWPRLRLALTPKRTKARRVHRRALMLFRVAAEQRTTGTTGVLLYLSLAERRAEIVADTAIHTRVQQEVWGQAMAALITAVKDGRPGDGMVEAVAQIGAILAEHFPRAADDVNELPDRLIEL